eukprot:IDg1714t1
MDLAANKAELKIQQFDQRGTHTPLGQLVYCVLSLCFASKFVVNRSRIVGSERLADTTCGLLSRWAMFRIIDLCVVFSPRTQYHPPLNRAQKIPVRVALCQRAIWEAVRGPRHIDGLIHCIHTEVSANELASCSDALVTNTPVGGSCSLCGIAGFV